VFVIAKIKEADFDILVWTTTPWTLSANVVLAVNPELDYALVKCEGFDRPIVMAKNAIRHVEGEKQVLRLMKGAELIGHKYETFFPQFDVQQDIVHKIIPWNEVDANEGSGIVHIAPGCGACIGCGPGVSDRADQVTVSAINRNYKGRSGPGQLYLASPLTVAASAVAGALVEYRAGMFAKR
jgi:hypothetical protein